MFICLAVSLLCIQLLLSRSSHRILQDGVCDVCYVCVIERRDGPASPLMRDRWLVVMHM